MISRDVFSVANNLGDSVAFNLESDKTDRNREGPQTTAVDHLAGPRAIGHASQTYCASEAKPLDRGGYPRTLKEMLIKLTYRHAQKSGVLRLD